MFEDIPQTVIQIVFYLTKDTITQQNVDYAKETDSFCLMSKPQINWDKRDYNKNPDVDLYLIINITRLVVSLLAIFYAFASIRQSDIEQSDFDERRPTFKKFNGESPKQQEICNENENL